MAAKNLIIVESPGKIKTLTKFLGKDYLVEASKGHVIDLPPTRMGVDLKKGFVPYFRVVQDREDVIERLLNAARGVQRILLAPDPDREGEAISWHLATVLNIDPNSDCRVTFNSITKNDVLKALEQPRSINLNLVNAQQSRRILDRIVGYRLSPLLWKKVCLGLSAGRVQSVAVLLICDREHEIMAFVPEEYWTIAVTVQTGGEQPFVLKLVKIAGKKADVTCADDAMGIVDRIKAADLRVGSVQRRVRKQAPPPPFITSTLQQEAAQKFSFTSRRTMSVAQRLYEGVDIGNEGHVGLITYMRTDSVRVSPEGLQEVQAYIREAFPPEFQMESPRSFKAKKGAQDAHEAIRPTSVWRTPDDLKRYLKPEALKLYSLIWKRFVASQMAEAHFQVLTVDVPAGDLLLQAVGTTLVFPGYTQLYSEAVAEDAAPKADTGKQVMPALVEGQEMSLVGVDPKQNFTQPPARFSEPMLIKTLEKEGIGRPSTYATIVETIQQRGYVKKVDGRFRPSEAAFLATKILTDSFGDIINTRFTAGMESLLDEIEDGRKDWVGVLTDFYGPFAEDLKKAEEGVARVQIATDCVCPACGSPMIARLGRTGKFLACTAYPACRTTEDIPEDIVIFDHGIPEGVLLLRARLDERKQERKVEEQQWAGQTCDACGAEMLVRTGKFGRFLACSKYPECRSTKPIVDATGIPCPLPGCSGQIQVKKSKRGRTFYGCSQYPTCTMTTWQKPTGGLCPECSTPLVWHSTKKLGTFVKCTKKGCSYRELPTGEGEGEGEGEVEGVRDEDAQES